MSKKVDFNLPSKNFNTLNFSANVKNFQEEKDEETTKFNNNYLNYTQGKNLSNSSNLKRDTETTKFSLVDSNNNFNNNIASNENCYKRKNKSQMISNVPVRYIHNRSNSHNNILY